MSRGLLKLYSRAPIWLQNALVSAEGWRLRKRRFGRDFWRGLEDIRDRPFLSYDDVQELQKARLREFLHVATFSHYWSGVFSRAGINVSGADPRAEVLKLAVIKKSDVQGKSELLRPACVKDSMNSCHTSGTTGAGLIFQETYAAERERWGVWWRYRNCLGITHDTWCGYFGGRAQVPVSQRQPPYWRVNRPGRQIMFSAYHLGPDTAKAYVDALSFYETPWLHGYPSSLSLLASYMIANEWRVSSVKVVTTGAENLLDSQKRLISEAFKCPVHQHYGQAEAVANFSECEEGRLHVDEDYSYVEFVPVDGEPGLYRVVGTNWSNPAFPLFRYDTGDLAQLGGACKCGRNGRVVLSVDGRKEDFVILPSGAMIGRLDHIFKDLTEIREAQIYQPSINKVILRIVKGDGFTRESEDRLHSAARDKLGRELNICIEFRDNLERTKAGKLRFVISELPQSRF